MTLGKAFSELWAFIEELNLDRPTEEELKDALFVLGRAARVPETLPGGLPEERDALEARFFLTMKYREMEVCPE